MKAKVRAVLVAIAALALLAGLAVVPAGAADPVPQIDLGVTKTDNMDPVQPGDTFKYQVSVVNNGPSGALEVYATDTLPAEVEFVSVSRAGCTFDGGSTVECYLGAMAPGQSKTFAITVQVRAGTPEGTFTNFVRVENREPDAPPPNQPPVDNNPDNDTHTEPTTVVLGSIGDTVWYDTNVNGVQDGGEPGLPGITVALDGPGGPRSTTTDGSGTYLFDGLVRGDYVVTVTGPARHDATTPTTHTVDLGLGQDYPDADFGFVNGSIGDFVWLDQNGDGVQDPGEDGLPDIVVEITGPGGDDSTATNAGGIYGFEALVAGEYTVSATCPVGSLPTTPSSIVVALAIGEDFPDADFGCQPEVAAPGELGDFVWFDIDGDGRQDAGEPGIGGARLTITGPAGSFTATTNSSGIYGLQVDPAGSYTVTVDQSSISITVDGRAVESSRIGATTTLSRTGVVPDNGANLTFDFGFTVILPPTGFTSGGVGLAGGAILLLGAGLVIASRRADRPEEE